MVSHSDIESQLKLCQGILASSNIDSTRKYRRVNHAERNNGDFVGWCERKPNPPLTTEIKGRIKSQPRTTENIELSNFEVF